MEKEAAALSTVPDIPIKGSSVWGFLLHVARSYCLDITSVLLDWTRENGTAQLVRHKICA